MCAAYDWRTWVLTRCRRLLLRLRLCPTPGPLAHPPLGGLPYHVGDVIPEEPKLLVANAAKFRNW